MAHLHFTCIYSLSTCTCSLIRVTNIPEQCNDPFPGASIFALTSCPNISAFESPSRCFLPFAWYLASFKSNTLNYWFILQRDRDWVGERDESMRVCVIWRVLVYISRACAPRCRRAGCFIAGFVFLAIKRGANIRHNAWAEGLWGSRLLSPRCAEQSRLLRRHEKSWLQHIRAAASPNTPMAVAGVQQM